MIIFLVGAFVFCGLVGGYALWRAGRELLHLRRLEAERKAQKPKPAPAAQKMMGFQAPGDERVPVPLRTYNAMKRGLWRAKVALDIASKQAAEMVERCRHSEGCPGAMKESEPCLASCPDREQRMSALVVLNAGRTLAPIDARKPEEQYFAPSREYFSEIIAELAAAQAELEAWRARYPESMSPPIDVNELPAHAPAPALPPAT